MVLIIGFLVILIEILIKILVKLNVYVNQIGYVMAEEYLTFDSSNYFELKDNKYNIV